MAERQKLKKNRHQVVNIGTSSMVVILIGLSFAVLAALAIASAKNDYKLSKQLADHTSDYYTASNKAMEIIAASDWADQSFEVELGESQVLKAKVENLEIVNWQVENVSDWEADGTLFLLQE